jgi:hypothetical protein
VLEKQGIATVFQVVMLVVRVVAITLGAWIGDVMTAVALFALGNCACTLASLAAVIRLSGNRWSQIWRPSLSALAWAVPLASPLILAGMSGIDRDLWFFALASAFLFIAARYTWLMKNAWS